MKRIFALLLLLFILNSNDLNAQRFKAFAALGANLTGDYLTDSGNSQVGTRLGLNAGPGVAAVLGRRWELHTEMLYSQNGHYAVIRAVPPVALNKITLHYVEVPVAFAYRFNIKKEAEADFYKRHISFGATYARLFEHKVLDVEGADVSDELRFDRENALLFNLGATSFFTESLALHARGTLSVLGEWTMAVRGVFWL